MMSRWAIIMVLVIAIVACKKKTNTNTSENEEITPVTTPAAETPSNTPTNTTCTVFGWASQNGGTTGGGTATATVVSSYAALKTAIESSTIKVIQINGTITFPAAGRINLQNQSGKTIYGSTGAKLVSTDLTASGSGILYVKNCQNLIIRNLIFEGPGAYDVDGNDNMTIDACTNVWVDHCEFQDALDGNLDIKNTANFITVSWCKFTYLKAPIPGGSGGSNDHRFCNLIGSSDTATGDRGTLKITFAYCWWSSGCVARMPRVRFGQVHVVNNYFSSTVSSSCIQAGLEADLRVEANVFENVKNPIDKMAGNYTAIQSINNSFINTTGTNTDGGTGKNTAFTPPYTLNAIAVTSVKASVTASSGAGATLTGNTCPSN